MEKDVPQRVSEIDEEGSQIPQELAVFHGDNLETNFFKLTFEHYNDKLCQVNEITKVGRAKKIIKALKDMSQCRNKGELTKKGIKLYRIHENGQGKYAKLFNKVGTSAEVYEHKTGDVSRIFYALLESEKIIGILAITNEKHF